MYCNSQKLEQLVAKLKATKRDENIAATAENVRHHLLSVPQPCRQRILMASNDLGSVLHKLAAWRDGTELIGAIANCLDQESFFKLVRIPDDCGQTALHVAASQSRVEVITIILEHLSPEKRLILLTKNDIGNATPIQCALKPDSNTSLEAVPDTVREMLRVIDRSHWKTVYPAQMIDRVVENLRSISNEG